MLSQLIFVFHVCVVLTKRSGLDVRAIVTLLLMHVNQSCIKLEHYITLSY